jgi:competence protein ComFC
MPMMGSTTRPKLKLYRLFWEAIDWVYPPVCGGCGKIGIRWCNECHQQVTRITAPICPHCGRSQPNSEVCSLCQIFPPACNSIRSWAVFQGPLRLAIHRLKYERDLSLGDTFAGFLTNLLVELDWKPDIVTAVPLSRERVRQRGYNQAEKLGKPIAMNLDLVFRSDVIERVRDTRSQIGLSAQERRINVNNAFLADNRLVLGMRILLVDDVLTTGATIQTCAQALLDAGADSVYGLTLAQAAMHSDPADR